jgi:hypothetical protein
MRHRATDTFVSALFGNVGPVQTCSVAEIVELGLDSVAFGLLFGGHSGVNRVFRRGLPFRHYPTTPALGHEKPLSSPAS